MNNPIINEGTIKLKRNHTVAIENRTSKRMSYPLRWMDVGDFFDVTLNYSANARTSAFNYRNYWAKQGVDVNFVTRTIHDKTTGEPKAARIIRVA